MLGDVESEFDRVSKIFSDRMQCRKGCGSCCSQLFYISLIEAAYVSRAVKGLDSATRQEMRDKARAYLAELTGAEVDEDQSIESHNRVVRASVDGKAGRHHIPAPR